MIFLLYLLSLTFIELINYRVYLHGVQVKSIYKIYYKLAIKIIFKNYNNNMKSFIVREYGR